MRKTFIVLMTIGMLLCGCSSKKNKNSESTVKHKSSKAPVVEVQNATITEGEELKDEDVCKIKNGNLKNYTITYSNFDNKKVGDQNVKVNIVDKSGNLTVKTTKITVKAKATPTPESTPTPTPEPVQQQPAVSQQQTQNNTTQRSTQRATQSQPTQRQYQPAQQPAQGGQVDSGAANATTGNPFGRNQGGAAYSSREACLAAKGACVPVFGNDGKTIIGYN